MYILYIYTHIFTLSVYIYIYTHNTYGHQMQGLQSQVDSLKVAAARVLAEDWLEEKTTDVWAANRGDERNDAWSSTHSHHAPLR